MRYWVYNPHAGGNKIPPAVQERTRGRILAYAEKHHQGKFIRIDVRFRGALCYIDAYTDPGDIGPGVDETAKQHRERLCNTPTHLCRIRFLGDENRWSFAFYTYSHEKYEISFLNSGDFLGTPEEAFEASAVYLQ